MKIFISGGGLAGLTLAYWLQKYGHTPVIIEKADGLRRDGYAIDFFGSGYDVAEKMGVLDTLKAQQIKVAYLSYLNEDGSQAARLDIDLMRRALDGRYLPLMHRTLEETLYNAIKDTVDIRFGQSLKAIAQTADSVTATFEDGSQESFDLLIGADGFHSNTRGLVFGPEENFTHYLGYYFACGTFPDDYQIGKSWKNYAEPGRLVGAYASDKEGEAISILIWEAPDEGYIPHAERLSVLREKFDGVGWLTSQILDDMPVDSIYMDTVTQIKMPVWSKGRVALVGDACGCMTLISGQGASMALGGAYILAEALSQYEDYAIAFRVYENQVRPEIEMRQEKAHDLAKSFVPGSELGLKVQKVVMKVVMRDAFKGVLRKEFSGDSVLRRALKRLPESDGNYLGYRLAGELHDVDYQTLGLDVEDALASHDRVNILVQIDSFEGIDLQAVWDDLKFGGKYRNRINKFAVVSDQHWSEWVSKTAQPLYTHESRYFHADELNTAWTWLRE